MKRFEFKFVFLDRIQLRQADSEATKALNALGAEGWHVVNVRDDAQHERDLAIFLERELS